MAVEDALAEEAVEQIVRASLRAVARVADQDLLEAGAERTVRAVLMEIIGDAASAIPVERRFRVITEAGDLLSEFVSACTAESA